MVMYKAAIDFLTALSRPYIIYTVEAVLNYQTHFTFMRKTHSHVAVGWLERGKVKNYNPKLPTHHKEF